MAPVTLPAARPPPPPIQKQPTASSSLPLPPRSQRPAPAPARPPSRTCSPAPVPPPRPESTLTSRSRKLSPPPFSGPGRGPNNHFVSLPPVSPLPRAPSPPLVSTVSAANSISLAAPRPCPDRVQNLYVDAPLRSGEGLPRPLPHISSGSSSHQKKGLASVHSGRSRSKGGVKDDTPLFPNSVSSSSSLPRNLVNPKPEVDSIICRECGKCKCNACQTPHKLPEYWLCGGSLKCSKDTVVDCLSCMWCVKALFYHCGKNWDETVEDSTNVFDKPCSCSTDYTCARWTCMGVMSLIMPCLLCYLPLRGCAKVSQAVYEKCTASGCRCKQELRQHQPELPPSSSPLPSPTTASFSANLSKASSSEVTSILSSPPSSPQDFKKRLLE